MLPLDHRALQFIYAQLLHLDLHINSMDFLFVILYRYLLHIQWTSGLLIGMGVGHSISISQYCGSSYVCILT